MGTEISRAEPRGKDEPRGSQEERASQGQERSQENKRTHGTKRAGSRTGWVIWESEKLGEGKRSPPWAGQVQGRWQNEKHWKKPGALSEPCPGFPWDLTVSMGKVLNIKMRRPVGANGALMGIQIRNKTQNHRVTRGRKVWFHQETKGKLFSIELK